MILALTQLMFPGVGYGSSQGGQCTLGHPYQQYSRVCIVKGYGFFYRLSLSVSVSKECIFHVLGLSTEEIQGCFWKGNNI